MLSAEHTTIISYQFIFEDESSKHFEVVLNKRTMDLVQEPKIAYPDWTKLEHHQCANCPLNKEETPYCPVAVSLIDMMHAFKDSVSYEPVKVIIGTDSREYHAQTVLQRGLSSLLGLYMVTSGCPIMERLKPMASMHLPFASMDETAYRVITMYLFAQYFRSKHGYEADWEMKDLPKAYDDIRILNQSFAKRLRSDSSKDAGVNAVVILNNFADYVPFTVDDDSLGEMELLFEAYFKSGPLKRSA